MAGEKFTNVTHRLREFLHECNLSVVGFENTLGTGKGVFAKALKNETGFNVKLLLEVGEKFPNLNMDWLINGRGSMLLNKPYFVLNNLEEYIKDFVYYIHQKGFDTTYILGHMDRFIEESYREFQMEKPKDVPASAMPAPAPGAVSLTSGCDEWKDKYYNLLEKYNDCLESKLEMKAKAVKVV